MEFPKIIIDGKENKEDLDNKINKIRDLLKKKDISYLGIFINRVNDKSFCTSIIVNASSLETMSFLCCIRKAEKELLETLIDRLK